MIKSAGKVVEKLEPSYIACGNAKMCNYCGKLGQFLKKLNIEVQYYTVIALLGMYTERNKNTQTLYTKTCIQILMAAVFIMAKK